MTSTLRKVADTFYFFMYTEHGKIVESNESQGRFLKRGLLMQTPS